MANPKLLQTSLVLCYFSISLCTILKDAGEISCAENQIFPQVFSINHHYAGKPLTHMEGPICNGVKKTCCANNEFYDLLDFWDKKNSEEHYSREQREYAFYLHNILSTYREQAEFAATQLRDNASNLNPKLKTAVDYVLHPESFTNEDYKNLTMESESCYTLNSYLLKGIMCAMCSPETVFRINKDSLFFDKREAAEFSEKCGPYLILLKKAADYLDAIGQIVIKDKFSVAIADRPPLTI
jgi:hypothetical protein